MLNDIKGRTRVPQGVRMAVREGMIQVHEGIREVVLWEEDPALLAKLTQGIETLQKWASK